MVTEPVLHADGGERLGATGVTIGAPDGEHHLVPLGAHGFDGLRIDPPEVTTSSTMTTREGSLEGRLRSLFCAVVL